MCPAELYYNKNFCNVVFGNLGWFKKVHGAIYILLPIQNLR